MNTIDKEDVNIKKLFYWHKPVEIIGNGNEVILKVYMRIVGDSELQQARAAALRESAKFRKLLKNDEDTRLSYIPEYEDYSADNLISAILTLLTPEVTRDAILNISVPIPKEPKSDADLEEQEEYRKKVDEWPFLRKKAIDDHVSSRLAEYEKIYKGYTKKQLEEEHERLLIAELCKNKMISTFRDYCIYFGVYSDENFTKRYFNTFEEFINLPTSYKEQFIDAYETLDIDTEELKK